MRNEYAIDPRWSESKKVVLGVLEDLMMDKVGVHALAPRPVKVPITRVVVDQNAPFKSPRRPPVTKPKATSGPKVN